jgi:hypothetical protein
MNKNLQGNCLTHFNKNSDYKPTFWQKVKFYFMKSRWESSSKYCPRCGNQALGQMTSLQIKFCPDCRLWFPWKLTKGQKGLF